MSDLSRGVNTLLNSVDSYQKAEAYYSGTVGEIFNADLGKVLSNKSAFTVNWCRTTVTEVLNRLEINAITAAKVDGSSDAVLDRVNAIIEDIWENNQLGLEASNIHEAALTYGDAYATVDVDSTGEVVIYFNSPKDTRVFYETENPRKVKYAIKSWITEDGYQRVNLYYTDYIYRFIALQKQNLVTTKFTHQDFAAFTADGKEAVLVNPTGVIPIFHFRTSGPYGRPEHFEAYGPQNMLNKLTSMQSVAIDFTTAPQKYALTEKPKDNFAPDAAAVFGKPAEDAPSPNLVASPGGMWVLDNIKDVGEFSPADPKAFLEPIDAYITAMAQATSTPIHAYQKSGTPPTGESRRMAEQPLLKKVSRRQLSFGHTWKELFKYALSLYSDDFSVNDLILACSWVPASQSDSEDYWKVVAAKQSAGVDRAQTLIDAGYNSDLVQEWLTEEDKRNVEA